MPFQLARKLDISKAEWPARRGVCQGQAALAWSERGRARGGGGGRKRCSRPSARHCKARWRRCEISIHQDPAGLHLCLGRGELNSVPAQNRALSPANLVPEIRGCGRDSEAPLRRKEEKHSSMPRKTLLLLISFSISQLDLAMTESNISLCRLVMVLMYKESTSKKMDQCYFLSCYHVHYCFNYQRSDNGYPRPISSSRTLSASRPRRACRSSRGDTSRHAHSSLEL